MSIRRFVLCLAGLVLATLAHAQPSKTGPVGLLPPEVLTQIVAKVSRQPMTFFVVNGAPDSCGRGCSQWIVAEGRFEPDTGARFKDFLATAARRRLPVFFHSPGGNLAGALLMAMLLRDHRMMAGIGRTTPEGCMAFGGGARSCRTVMDAGTELRGTLQEDSGICMSACVIAFAGAPTRRVHPGVVLGTHSARLNPQAAQKRSKTDSAKLKSAADVHKDMMRYLLRWGVDPDLVIIGGKFPASRMYVLSRVEIDRLGMETRDLFETPWYVLDTPSGQPVVSKAITLLSGTSPPEFSTTQFFIPCAKAAVGLMIGYQRELPVGTQWHGVPTMMQFDHAMLQAIGQTKVIRFELVPPNAPTARVIDLSTAGLAEHLVELRKRCPQAS